MELTSIRYSIRQLTVLVAMLTTLCVFGTAAMQPEQKQDKVLASEKMLDGAMLTLYSHDLAKPSAAAKMRYLLNTKPAAGAGTDTVFYLSYLPLGSKVASTVWVVYRAVHVMAPWPQFYAALINDPNDHPFLIFVESNTKGSSFSIYKVDLAKRLADASPQLNPERKEEWPRPAEALSSVSYGISKTEVLSGCYFSAIDAAWKNNTITVEARRNPEVCGSLLTSFDVNSAKWADVQRSDTGK